MVLPLDHSAVAVAAKINLPPPRPSVPEVHSMRWVMVRSPAPLTVLFSKRKRAALAEAGTVRVALTKRSRLEFKSRLVPRVKVESRKVIPPPVS